MFLWYCILYVLFSRVTCLATAPASSPLLSGLLATDHVYNRTIGHLQYGSPFQLTLAICVPSSNFQFIRPQPEAGGTGRPPDLA